MIERIRLAAVLVLSAGSALPAAAQCNLYRSNVPDFDQKRDALPGDGGMYCVPTSAVNWAAYIANHGYPLMMSGPRNWQSNTNYNFVTTNIDFMGDLMDTTASGGTGGDNGLDGLDTYLFLRAPFLFNATVWYGNITPLQMYFQMGTNGLVNICYGYYKQNSSPLGFNYYTRDGGHCVTLNGITNVCSPSSPTVRVRNPADDSGLFNQSTFTTVTSRAITQTFNSNVLGTNKTRTRLADFGVDSTTRRYIDTMYVIRAAFSCWSAPSTSNVINITSAISLAGDFPSSSQIFLPNGELISIALHPDQTHLVYTRRLTGPVAGPSHFATLVNLADGSQRPLTSLSPAANGKTPIAFNRFGDLYICDGSTLKIFDVFETDPKPKDERPLAQPASSLAFDDVLDELVVLTPSNRRLIRLSLDLDTAIDQPLPSSVPAIGDGSVVPDPATGKYIIAISGDPHIRELSLIPGTTRLQLDNSLLLPAVQEITDIQPADGGAFFVLGDGSVRTLVRGERGVGDLRLSPVQAFADLPAMKTMSMSRSRTNFDPREHSGPEWNNVIDVNEGVTPVPDCAADFNGDGIRDVTDLFAYINAWLAKDANTDVDFNGSTDVADLFAYINKWLAGC